MKAKELEHYIAQNQIDKVESLILSQPALLQEKSSKGISFVRLACLYKHPEMAHLIAEHCPSLDIHEICCLGRFDDLPFLIYKQPDLLQQYSTDGYSPLGLASWFGHVELVRFLLLRGADANQSSNNGLDIFPIHSAAANNHLNIIKVLTEAGARVNVNQKDGTSPLHYAAQNGNIALIILLLEQGANAEAKTANGQRPADMAKARGFDEIAQILAS